MTRIKVCGILNPDEVRMAVDAGAHAIGLRVAAGGKNSEGVSADAALAITRATPPSVDTFVLTGATSASAIGDAILRTRARTVQVDKVLDPSVYEGVRTTVPWVKIVQTLRVMDGMALVEAFDVLPHVDALLLDAGEDADASPGSPYGPTSDWEVCQRISEGAGVPAFLSGGLHAENIREAIEQVRPFAVDVSAGVRTDGALDAEKLRAFVDSVRGVVA